MKKLLVFIGKPGVGKSTLIKNAFPKHNPVDVLPFIYEFRNPDGSTREDKLIISYQKMYEHLNSIKDEFILLEIGTGFPEFNVSALKKLELNYDLKIYLCTATEETHWKRANERGMRHSTEAFKLRMQRDFPGTHKELLEKSLLPYSILDMEQPLETITKVVLES